jgi:hypothetical protein
MLSWLDWFRSTPVGVLPQRAELLKIAMEIDGQNSDAPVGTHVTASGSRPWPAGATEDEALSLALAGGWTLITIVQCYNRTILWVFSRPAIPAPPAE